MLFWQRRRWGREKEKSGEEGRGGREGKREGGERATKEEFPISVGRWFGRRSTDDDDQEALEISGITGMLWVYENK